MNTLNKLILASTILYVLPVFPMERPQQSGPDSALINQVAGQFESEIRSYVDILKGAASSLQDREFAKRVNGILAELEKVQLTLNNLYNGILAENWSGVRSVAREISKHLNLIKTTYEKSRYKDMKFNAGIYGLVSLGDFTRTITDSLKRKIERIIAAAARS